MIIQTQRIDGEEEICITLKLWIIESVKVSQQFILIQFFAKILIKFKLILTEICSSIASLMLASFIKYSVSY